MIFNVEKYYYIAIAIISDFQPFQFPFTLLFSIQRSTQHRQITKDHPKLKHTPQTILLRALAPTALPFPISYSH
jgi:hypothetical protein